MKVKQYLSYIKLVIAAGNAVPQSSHPTARKKDINVRKFSIKFMLRIDHQIYIFSTIQECCVFLPFPSRTPSLPGHNFTGNFSNILISPLSEMNVFSNLINSPKDGQDHEEAMGRVCRNGEIPFEKEVAY